jgi:hypothetical protein
VGRGIAVSLWSQKNIPANQRFRLAIAVPNLDRGELILAAAGERIVAFARPGKPPQIPFWRQMEGLPTAPTACVLANSQRFLKPIRIPTSTGEQLEWH